MPPTRDTMTTAERAFLLDVTEAAKQACVWAWFTYHTRILPSTCIAQALHETRFGSDDLHQRTHNYFGIKATGAWRGEVAVVRTYEWIKGCRQLTSAAYRAYPDMAAGFRDYARLVATSGYYRRAVDILARGLTAGRMPTWEYYTRSLGAVWSSDPQYGDALVALIHDLDLLAHDT